MEEKRKKEGKNRIELIKMSRLRRSTRATTSTINVKLNEQNEIEYFKVENETEENDVIDDPHALLLSDNDENDDEDYVNDEHCEDDEEEEELIANADGTMSIKIPEKKPKQFKVPVHHICAKCSKVLSSGAVRTFIIDC